MQAIYKILYFAFWDLNRISILVVSSQIHNSNSVQRARQPFYSLLHWSSLGGTALDRSHGHAYCLLYRRITPAMSLKCCKLWQQEKSESGERSTRLAQKTEQIPEQCVMSTRMKLCEWVSEAT